MRLTKLLNPTSTIFKTPAPPCYLSHPILHLAGGILIGGSAFDPAPADVYVGLTRDMKLTSRRLPWRADGIDELMLPVRDMEAPVTETAITEFREAVEWVCNKLERREQVHVGCHGGHGRTGMFITAVVATLYDRGALALSMRVGLPLLGERKFIEWVRARYCHRAVETAMQVQFLVDHYDCKPARALKKPLPKVKTPWWYANQ